MGKTTILILLFLIIACKAQNSDNLLKNKQMEYSFLNKYKDWEIDDNYFSSIDNTHKFYKKEDKRVKITLLETYSFIKESSVINPYSCIFVYDTKKEFLIASAKYFYNVEIGVGKQYDNIGKLIKEEDYDKGYSFSIENLVQKISNEYHINLEDIREEAFVKRRKEKDELYYEVHIKDKKLFDKYRYILVDGKEGTILFDTLYNFRGYNEVSPFDQYLKSLKYKKNNSKTTTSFNGKTYTEEEWKAFEQEQWEKYQANKNHKSFWDKLFG